jgi:hypothetical protein
VLNNQQDLDFSNLYNRVYHDAEQEVNPYSNVIIDSKFYTFDTLCNTPTLIESPLFLSINIQNLNSKHAELCFTIEELQKKNVKIDVIAIQETWEIRYPELVNIPGFQTFVFKNRANMRGGGVGFYVRNGLKFCILDDLSPFEDKIFESLTIKLTNHCNKSVLLTKFVRMSTTDNVNRFRALLAASDWSDVTNSQCVDSSYDAFWSTYSNLFEICFPLKKVRFNRNIHKKNQFMTEGLLTSRRTKQHLYEQTLIDASEVSLARYKNFSRIYYKTVRAAKKLYYSRLLASNAKNVKKTCVSPRADLKVINS